MPNKIVRHEPPVDQVIRLIDAAAVVVAPANADRLHDRAHDAFAARRDHAVVDDGPSGLAPEPIDARTIRVALAKILKSEAFRHSERHRVFLSYIVEAVVAGRGRQLKEVVVGLDVFDRRLDRYDTRRDSIVRVEARRLRQKLVRYYEDEGADDPIEIRLDAGSYVPTFAPGTRGRRARSHRSLVVVMPLVILGSGDLASVVAGGLVDQMIDRVGSLRGLHVMAPLATGATGIRDVAPAELHAKHGVDFVIDGSVTQVGSKLRCVVHVSSTSDRVCRWSRVFDFNSNDGSNDGANEVATDGDDVFAWQDRITAALCDAIGDDATMGR